MTKNFKESIHSDIDVVFVCVPNNLIPKVVNYALSQGKHVFCEKPPGRNLFDIRSIIQNEKKSKILIAGAISKFEGHVYTFNFKNFKNSPCLRCFVPDMPIGIDENCDYEGIIGSLAGIIGSIQANEIIKEILGVGNSLCGNILVIDSLKLNFRKIKLNKNNQCIECSKYK